jgi:hypothetical protein
VAWTGRDLADILSVQEERVVGNDNTVRYERRVLQIPADRHRHHYVKCKVRVHEYPDGRPSSTAPAVWPATMPTALWPTPAALPRPASPAPRAGAVKDAARRFAMPCGHP